MSYHVQQNTQQKTFGLFIVFAFHVILIWAVLNGLGIIKTTPEPTFNPKVFEEHQPVTPPLLPTPENPTITNTKVVFTNPVQVEIEQTPTTVNPPIVDGGGDTGGIIAQTSFTKPTIRKATKPDYPIAASRLGEEGTTGLQLNIAADGHVTDAQVFKSSGSLRLDTAAVKHVIRSWTFNPCTQDGKAVACMYKANLTWRLQDAER